MGPVFSFCTDIQKLYSWSSLFWIIALQYVICCFSLAAFKIFFLTLIFDSLIIKLSMVFFMLVLLGTTDFLKSVNLCLSPTLERFGALFLQICLTPQFSSTTRILSILSPQISGALSFLFFWSAVFLSCVGRIIFVDLCSSSISLSFFISILSPSSEF